MRRSKPSRRHERKLTDFERATGWRYQITATSIDVLPKVPGSHHGWFLDALYRHRGAAEDQVKAGKAQGLRNLPSKIWDVNASWMLAAKSKNRSCAYKWMQYTSTPPVQAQIAKSYGAAPVSAAGCALMERSGPRGSCADLRGNATPAFLRSVRFWKTPLADCGTGSKTCVAYADWQRAWIRIQG